VPSLTTSWNSRVPTVDAVKVGLAAVALLRLTVAPETWAQASSAVCRPDRWRPNRSLHGTAHVHVLVRSRVRRGCAVHGIHRHVDLVRRAGVDTVGTAPRTLTGRNWRG
jgi:hypothetical protein